MIDLVLDDLCRKAGECIFLFVKFHVAVSDFNPLIPYRFSLSKEGKTAFFCFILLGGCFCTFRIQHHDMGFSYAYSYDAFPRSDHVGGKAYAVSDMRLEGIKQIVRKGKVSFCRSFRWLREKYSIRDDWQYGLHPYL